jgi:hypothetical protein
LFGSKNFQNVLYLLNQNSNCPTRMAAVTDPNFFDTSGEYAITLPGKTKLIYNISIIKNKFIITEPAVKGHWFCFFFKKFLYQIKKHLADESKCIEVVLVVFTVPFLTVNYPMFCRWL